MSPWGYLACFALGAVVAGVGFWLATRAIDRGWWPWLDRMNEDRVIKVLVTGCAVIGIAWIAVFVTFIVLRVPS